MFQRLSVNGWRQFKAVDLTFHDSLTVLTGANGTGKTSLLQILARHFGWYGQFVATPGRDTAGSRVYDAGSREHELTDLKHPVVLPDIPPNYGSPQSIGYLEYTTGQVASIGLPTSLMSAIYDLVIFNQQVEPGMYFQSHRLPFTYQQARSIPAAFVPAEQVLNLYQAEVRSRLLGTAASAKTPSLLLKEFLLSAAIYGYEDSRVIEVDVSARAMFEAFEDLLSRLLPASLGFRGLGVVPPEVLFRTATGDFPVEALSGGLVAVVDTAWQIFLRNQGVESFIVCFDDPESHLHPRLQREFLPALIRAFPSIQFIVATHSPFVVTADRNSLVYVLDYDEHGRVSSLLLDQSEKAGTSNDVLREVLGMSTTLSLWVEQKLQELIERYRVLPLTESTLEHLRQDMARLGLEATFPDAASEVLKKGSDRRDI